MRTIGDVSPAVRVALAPAAGLGMLERVVRWVAPRGGDVVDIVVQDEFTHDVVVATDGVFLVFDTT